MGIYSKQQQMVDSACEDIQVCIDMVGPKSPGKEKQYGFLPGMDGMALQVEAMEHQIHALRQGIFQVLFTGGFNVGKSTVLNALMSKNLLRTSIKAETAVITKIIFNAEEKVTVYSKNVDRQTGKHLTEVYTVDAFFEKFRVNQENPELFENIAYVELQQPQDGIGGSLVQLVDSPGTDNSKVDTTMARSFAEKASAVVYLINALKSFEFDEMEYIRSHYAGKGMKNLFFVVNRVNQLNGPEQLEEVKDRTRHALEDVFTVDGLFDQKLYDRRVFYVDAYGSFHARLGKPIQTPYGPIQVDDGHTGVPEFQAALGKFLTQDSRDKDALAAYVPRLAGVFTAAEQKVREELAIYAQGLDKTKADRDKLEKQMKNISLILSLMRDACGNTAQAIVHDAKGDFDTFVNAVEKDWDDYFRTADVDFSVMRMMRVVLTRDEERRSELLKPITQALSDYIGTKQEVLKKGMAESLSLRLNDLQDKLHGYQRQLEQSEIPVKWDSVFDSIAKTLAPDIGTAPGMRINFFQLILGVLGNDVENLVGSMGGGQGNMEALQHFIVVSVVELVLIAIDPALFIIYFIGRWVKELACGGQSAAERAISKMKPNVINELRNAKSKFAMELEKNVGAGIIRSGDVVTGAVQTELDGYKASLDGIIKNLNEGSATIESEKARTDALLKVLAQRISHISQLTDGKELTPAGIRALSTQ